MLPLQAQAQALWGEGIGDPARVGPYLMELSDETSRSESSVSLGGGGGGSLGGTAVKAGDFLEKDTSCHSGVTGKKPSLPWAHPPASGWVTPGYDRCRKQFGAETECWPSPY